VGSALSGNGKKMIVVNSYYGELMSNLILIKSFAEEFFESQVKAIGQPVRFISLFGSRMKLVHNPDYLLKGIM